MKPELNFIGAIETPYTVVEECPNNIQPDGPLCRITLYDEFLDGLSGLKIGQHILILYWLENTDRSVVLQPVGHGEELKGTFALRSPHRPNPIAAAVLPIESIEVGQITVRGLDCLDNTQLVDVKPAMYREVEPLKGID
jgi:tRNA-Thr(GGU) m(6)t(6)A37 methyltransferase TsaA